MKILVIRFSSIGDIVLTTPVLRALKLQRPDIEVHYLTKKGFTPILNANPYIDKLITFDKHYKEKLSDLKKEEYDHVIDLHNNFRTLKLKMALGRPSTSFPKLNVRKWMLVRFKKVKMPELHVVERYFKAVATLGVENDNGACEFYLTEQDKVDTMSSFVLHPKQYITVAVGAQYATKRMSAEKIIEVLQKISIPAVLCGGPMDREFADEIIAALPGMKIENACGGYTLGQSASIVAQSAALLTNDTGLMHIATCFQVPIVSVWGNTVPELGMYPYYPNNKELFTIQEVKDLSCRPCSKIGYQKCPKGHFNCMVLQNSEAIANDLKRFIKED